MAPTDKAPAEVSPENREPTKHKHTNVPAWWKGNREAFRAISKPRSKGAKK